MNIEMELLVATHNEHKKKKSNRSREVTAW